MEMTTDRKVWLRSARADIRFLEAAGPEFCDSLALLEQTAAKSGPFRRQIQDETQEMEKEMDESIRAVAVDSTAQTPSRRRKPPEPAPPPAAHHVEDNTGCAKR